MGSCTGRHFLLTICIFQSIVVIECQVFDFMGFMYGPIVANFFHIILIIFGFFGTFQYSHRYILAYCLWNIFWIAWSIFIICFYLDVGVLDKNSDILNLGTGSRSWWEVHGYGCIADFTTAITNGSSLEQDPDPSRPPKPTKVDGCLIEYQYIEVIQASLQCLLSILGVMGGLYVSRSYLEEDDSSQAKEGQPRSGVGTTDYNYQTSRRHLEQYQQQIGYGPQAVSPRPMTPRRVKRRSVLARDTMNRSSLTHRRQTSSRSRSSQRRLRSHQNPVTRLLEQQNRYLDPSTSFNDVNRLEATSAEPVPAQDLIHTKYSKTGFTNPVFQQSSNSSLNQSGGDEIYRPQSARSSYSNYHASRPISYLHNNEYFSNQAVAQVPINTNRNKSNVQSEEAQNNLQPNLNTTTLKSFSHKNFNFLGFNLKNNNVSGNNNNSGGNSNNNNVSCNNNNNNEHPSRTDSGLRNSKRFRVDLTRGAGGGSNCFFSQGPPAYREGGLDSETVI